MMGFGILWLLLLLLVVGALVALLVTGTNSGGESRAGSGQTDPQEILRQRLAAGEIDEDEYRERAELLSSTHAGRTSAGRTSAGQTSAGQTSSARWVAVAVLVGAAAVLVGLLATGTGMGSGWWGSMGDHVGGMMGTRSDPGETPDALPDAREVTVEAGEMWFEPATVEVAVGESINLTVVNNGQVLHDLTIDELDFRIVVDSGQSETAGLTVDEPGTYDFYCSVPGHASAGMRGTLVVEDNSG